MTVFFMLSFGGFIVAEKNSLKTGVREIKSSLCLYYSENNIQLVVNDRELKFSLMPVKDALNSRQGTTFLLVLLSL